jgi:hypothetical protein
MDKINITVDSALQSLKQVMEEMGPEYRYKRPGTRCVYAHGGQPSCGVGRALVNLGLTVEEVATLDTANYGNSIGAHALDQAPIIRDRVNLDPHATTLFAVFQSRQDQGDYYLYAYQAAHARYMEIQS